MKMILNQKVKQLIKDININKEDIELQNAIKISGFIKDSKVIITKKNSNRITTNRPNPTALSKLC